MSKKTIDDDKVNTRQLAEFIESKQYKKALKAADNILKKHPKHGETQCRKSSSFFICGGTRDPKYRGETQCRKTVLVFL